MLKGKYLSSVALVASLVLTPLTALAENAPAISTTPAPPGTFPYPGPAYSPIAMTIGMLALTIGFIVGIARIIRNDILVKIKERKSKKEHETEGLEE